jgi:protein-export membrane protein SecD
MLIRLASAVGVILLAGLAAWQLAPVLIGSLWGTRMVLQADTSAVPDGDRSRKLVEALEVMRRRVEAAGWLRPTIEADSGARILVHLPGVEDANSAQRLLTRPAQMDFREKKGEQGKEEWVPAMAVGNDGVEKPLTGRYFKSAEVGFDRTQRPIILFEFNEEGAKLLADITTRLGGTALKRELGIFLDGQPVSTPRVQEAITGGRGQITGSFTLDEARELVRQLSGGPLPIPVAFVEAHTTRPLDLITGLRAAVNPPGVDPRGN